MPFATARILLLALASLDSNSLHRLTPDDPAEAARFRAMVGAFQQQRAKTRQATLDSFLGANHWREVDRHGRLLAAYGDEAVHAVISAINFEELDERRVRDCYQWLLRHFPDNPWTRATAVEGLRSDAAGVRYECAFFLGRHRVYGAHRDLRRVMEDLELGELIRYTAAKSLAELGEPDAVRALYEAAGSDAYMDRYMAHLGFLALAGKTPDDFGGYAYGEGAMVSGGNEYMVPVDGLTLAERRAGRYRALAYFCAWLKAERPELYKHLATSDF